MLRKMSVARESIQSDIRAVVSVRAARHRHIHPRAWRLRRLGDRREEFRMTCDCLDPSMARDASRRAHDSSAPPRTISVPVAAIAVPACASSTLSLRRVAVLPRIGVVTVARAALLLVPFAFVRPILRLRLAQSPPVALPLLRLFVSARCTNSAKVRPALCCGSNILSAKSGFSQSIMSSMSCWSVNSLFLPVRRISSAMTVISGSRLSRRHRARAISGASRGLKRG